MRSPLDSPFFPDGVIQAYQWYRLELLRFFELNSRDKDVVNDLMQTMFLQLIKGRPTAARVRDPRLYLFRTAWNVLHNANQTARRKRHLFVSCNVEELDRRAQPSNQLWVEDDGSSRVQQAELNRALAMLPRACQIAMLRQYRDNKSYKEIAAELGVTTHTVKKYMMKALNHLRVQLNVTMHGLDQDGERP